MNLQAESVIDINYCKAENKKNTESLIKTLKKLFK